MLPSIAAVVGVRDEHELIARCVAHLEALHVTSIVVVDNGSTDGTREILQDLQREGRVALVETDGDPCRDGDYFQRGIALAKQRFRPDWILVQDADEFWMHRSGDLRRALIDNSSDVLTVDRFNACCAISLDDFVATGRGDIWELSLHVEPLRLSPAAMADGAAVRWITAQPAPKLVARAATLTGVSTGGHAAINGEGKMLLVQAQTDLLIVHIPFSSFERFLRKIENAKSIIALHGSAFPGATAWHWKRWIALLDKGDLEREFAHQHLSPAEMDLWMTRGAVCRAGRYLHQRSSQP